MSNILTYIRLAISLIPTAFMVWRVSKANIPKISRNKQFPMPIVALIYAILVIIFFDKLIDLSNILAELLSKGLTALGELISRIDVNVIKKIGEFIANLGNSLLDALHGSSMHVILVILNFILMTIFLVIKRVLNAIFKRTFVQGNELYENVSRIFYETEDGDVYFVKNSTVQARTFLKVLLIGSTIIAALVMFCSVYLYDANLIQQPFSPVLGIILIGELFYYIDGLSKEELETQVSAEEDNARSLYNYILVRRILRRLFGDKLNADNTTINNDILSPSSAEELIGKYELSDDRDTEIYAKYMRRFVAAGNKVDANYVASGLELLKGNSILFNNPFYYDLIPYAFYPMNHALLKHQKVLVILGRHGIENDVIEWCDLGLRKISNIRGLWRIGVLSDESDNLDVGIVTRSDVQNLKMHRTNANFFADTGYVVIIEPSKLVSTAQIGLNSIVRYCRKDEYKPITFCMTDKNCDGLIDSVSHALMTSISEVSATEAHSGVCSYMSWMADSEYLQHRMMPDIARYLGIGTEMSFAALKNQISKTQWFGGDAFPVVDMHWVAKQYYSKLLNYAELPLSQTLFDDVFVASANMWNASKEDKAYITVEDESNNIFEIKRDFSTRAYEQSFVNIISSQYLLCDYMSMNDSIFNADSKAIPYIVSDYVTTKRNVLLRVLVQMAAGYMWEKDVIRELLLANIYKEDIIDSIWTELCKCYNPISFNAEEMTLKHTLDGKDYLFTSDVLAKKERYSVQTGRNEVCYCIEDEEFINVVLDDLTNARYIAEEDNGDKYIGTELKGQIFQKYLPGVLFTLCGKYYEMVNTTYDDQIVLRRAADHIVGRPLYRQVRQYKITDIASDPTIGSEKQINKMKVSRYFADISVDTLAYWKMDAYNDFANAKRISVNNIPTRSYNNKWILCIDFNEFGEKFTPEIRYTLTNMFNEVFRTLFAENQDFIIATTKGEPGIPLTYGLTGECENFDDNAIYIIEDSQYDIGLLTAVERNLSRIFQIICDYFEWNKEEIEKSIKDEKEAPDYRVDKNEYVPEETEDNDKEKKKNIFSRIIDKIKGLFKRDPNKKKKKEKKKKEIEETEEKTTDEKPTDETQVEETPTEEIPPTDETVEKTPADEVLTEGNSVEESSEEIPGEGSDIDNSIENNEKDGNDSESDETKEGAEDVE